jgi:hypothetical protein
LRHLLLPDYVSKFLLVSPDTEIAHKEFVNSITYASYLVASCLPPICNPTRAQLLDVMQRVHKDFNNAMLRDFGRLQDLEEDHTVDNRKRKDRDIQLLNEVRAVSTGSTSSLEIISVGESSVRAGKRRRLEPEELDAESL